MCTYVETGEGAGVGRKKVEKSWENGKEKGSAAV
jgi:hypothetical protein